MRDALASGLPSSLWPYQLFDGAAEWTTCRAPKEAATAAAADALRVVVSLECASSEEEAESSITVIWEGCEPRTVKRDCSVARRETLPQHVRIMMGIVLRKEGGRWRIGGEDSVLGCCSVRARLREAEADGEAAAEAAVRLRGVWRSSSRLWKLSTVAEKRRRNTSTAVPARRRHDVLTILIRSTNFQSN
jgi:hypothetical protein